ncbi:VCBS repeat-containing protein [Streptomyces sp. A7024]|uniref:VCBS repeat-containing protein n=1 Tax=Streptomyces coryli TaxID=1128680 RepID=A0A6G4TX95_9ACTN|nr:VCBS repeat-containing protein [Streptomyces coryli]
MRHRAAIGCGTAALLLLTACGDAGGEGGEGGDRATGRQSAVPTPTATAPVPRGKGSALPDDVNGDGHPDLVYVGSVPSGQGAQGYLAIVYGSANGIDPATRWVALPGTPAALETSASPATTADLDGDRYADIMIDGKVVWGGPAGPGRRAEPTRWPQAYTTPGDYNGDGRTELAVLPHDKIGETPPYRIEYGPFTRSGTPRSTGPPTWWPAPPATAAATSSSATTARATTSRATRVRKPASTAPPRCTSAARPVPSRSGSARTRPGPSSGPGPPGCTARS